jgi:hypothetical protein
VLSCDPGGSGSKNWHIPAVDMHNLKNTKELLVIVGVEFERSSYVAEGQRAYAYRCQHSVSV